MNLNNIKIGNNFYNIACDDSYLEGVAPEGVFEPEMCHLFSSLIQENDHVIDIGANIGCTTILFSQLSKTVKSFEASPSTFVFLQKNIQQLTKRNVEIFNLGLGNKEETLTLTFAPSNRSGGFISNKTQASEGHIIESVEITKGDDLFSPHTNKSSIGTPKTQIDFIKIDTEGFELEVLRGLKNTINIHKPVCVLEMNHWCLNAFQRISIPEFLDEILNLFPIAYAFDKASNSILNLHNTNDRYHAMYHHIVMGFQYQDIVCAFHPGKLARFLETYQ